MVKTIRQLAYKRINLFRLCLYKICKEHSDFRLIMQDVIPKAVKSGISGEFFVFW